MLLRRRLGPGGEIENKDRDEVAPSLEMNQAAVDPDTRPRRGRHFEQVNAEILGYGYAFFRRPGGVSVEQHFGVRDVGDWLVHRLTSANGHGTWHNLPSKHARHFRRAWSVAPWTLPN